MKKVGKEKREIQRRIEGHRELLTAFGECGRGVVYLVARLLQLLNSAWYHDLSS